MATRTRFTCGESLDIVNANNLLSRLQKALDKSSHIEITANKVSRCDTAGLQLFVSLKQELDATGGTMTWKTPSDVLIDSAKRLGLEKILNLSH